MLWPAFMLMLFSVWTCVKNEMALVQFYVFDLSDFVLRNLITRLISWRLGYVFCFPTGTFWIKYLKFVASFILILLLLLFLGLNTIGLKLIGQLAWLGNQKVLSSIPSLLVDLFLWELSISHLLVCFFIFSWFK